MAKSPFGTFSTFGKRPAAKQPKATSPFAAPKPAKVDRPAPRNSAYERMLCEAIAGGLAVALRYDADTAERVFGADAVYVSTTGKVLVEGTQLENPADTQNNGSFRPFEVGKITSLRVTDRRYAAKSIDRRDARYKSVICSV